MTTARTTWRATYADTGEPAKNVLSARYTPTATYREAQAEANRSGRKVIVRPDRGWGAGRDFEPEA